MELSAWGIRSFNKPRAIACRADVVRDSGRRSTMLYWALIFLVVAIVAGIFGFGGIAATASSIAQVLFFIFLVLFIISLFFGWRGGAFGP
jgi:uncharacterized membrane protein YtjA (UPF0391 family)